MNKGEFCEFPEDNASEIIPNLWLGNYKSSCEKEFIVSKNIRHIIRVMPVLYNDTIFPDVKYVNIPIVDKEMCNKNLNELFDTLSDYIRDALIKKKPVLIHCRRGHHRSATVLVAFFIKYLKLDYFEIILYINKKRPCALRRNTCMVNGLLDYYMKCQNKVITRS